MSFAKNRGFYQFGTGKFLFLNCVSSHTLLPFRLMRNILLVTLLFYALLPNTHAQPVTDDLPQVTGCLALLHARVIQAPGLAPKVADVIVRDGLIQQIGPDLRIPPDAYRIAADSLYIYPAFIDAFSDTGIHDPEGDNSGRQGQGAPNRNEDRPKPDAEGNLPLEEAGITPFLSVRSAFDPADKSISDWRAQGFAVAHIVPKGKMIPGKGAIIVLAGTLADQMLWKEDVSMYAQWSGAGGSYPSTVIGIMAKWRELYHNAEQAMAHQSSYDHASLVPRPSYNQAHEALIPVVRKEMPVYFRAPRVRDISRTLALQRDLGMNLVLADAEEAWYYKDQFKTAPVPMILSLDLPAEPREKEQKPKEEPEKSTVPPDPEKEAFEQRRQESLKAHRAQAAVLSNAGIRFSLGTMSCKPGDFIKNIRMMIDQGLPADKALEALTTTPAALLHIDKHCGTVEVGKMANLMVTTKPVFEPASAIRYMIVEGHLYAYEVKQQKTTAHHDTSAASMDLLEGKWTYTIDIPDDAHKGFFEFTRDGETLTGEISSDEITSGNTELEDIVIDNGTVSFTFDFDAGGSMISLEFDLNVDGDSYTGKVTIPGAGTFDISGNRISKPKE